MSFINKHKVILLKAVDRNGLDLSFFLEFVHINNDNLILTRRKAPILIEDCSRNRRQHQFFEMLLAHSLIRCKDNNLVDRKSAVSSSGSSEVISELEDINMHDQRFAAAGRTHIGELVQLVNCIVFKANPA